MSNTMYWIWLAQKIGAGNAKLPYLLDQYSSPFEIFRAESEEIEKLNISERMKTALSDKDMREVYAISDYCAKNNITIIPHDSEKYPSMLRLLKAPPAVLYVKGNLPNFENTVSIAMVGTRKMSEYGKRSAYKIAYELAAAGVTVVSGMALGVDAVAACGAICAGGKTVAVLGGGVDVVYPKQHAKLYENIIENGAVISEYPPTTGPYGENFPVRNRIISGLCNGTLVIECDKISGAMITARRTLEQGRDLFAIPGKVGETNATGTNLLLHDGANIVLTSDDILKVYEFYYGHSINYSNLSYAKAHSELDESKLEKMGIFTRSEGRVKKVSHKDADTNNMLRPKRATPFSYKEEDNTKSARVSKGKKKDSLVDNKEANKAARVNTESELASLNEKQREIFAALPDDRAISLDKVMRMGYTCSEAMGALAVLEVRGFISSLPGGLYIKN